MAHAWGSVSREDQDKVIAKLRSVALTAGTRIQRAFDAAAELLASNRKGTMTAAEAGQKGGQTVSRERGLEFYEEIGRKGGHKVRDLINAGRKALDK